MTNAEVLQQVDRGYRMPNPPGCPDGLYAIMLDTWKQVLAFFPTVVQPSVLTCFVGQFPEDRPTFESLQWRLEDFFVNTGANYTEANNVM
jgi:fyn-related kinase